MQNLRKNLEKERTQLIDYVCVKVQDGEDGSDAFAWQRVTEAVAGLREIDAQLRLLGELTILSTYDDSLRKGGD